jgi:hypothetical protein
MSAPARSSQWARELLAGRAVWQPLGVILSLWAWFGWLALWLAALLPERSGLRSPNAAVFIIAAALLGHASATVANRLNLSRLTAATSRLLVLLILLGTAWRVHRGADTAAPWEGAWIVALSLGYTWWRAGRLSAGEALEPDATLRRVFIGMLLSAAAIVLFPEATRDVGAAFLPLYVGGGLAGIALGQVQDASRRRGGRPLPFGLSWHIGLVLGIGFIALLGVGVGRLLASGPAWGVAGAAARLLVALGRTLTSILGPAVEALLRLFGPIFDAIVRVLRSWLEGAQEVSITVPQPIPPAGAEGGEGNTANEVLAQVGVVLRFLVTVLGAAVFLWLAIRITPRVRQTLEDGEVELIEAAREAEGKGRESGWRSILRSALRRPGRARGLYHALLVRRVYAQLLEWAASKGRPRKPAETPLEFGAALAGIWPPLRQDLDVITRAYLEVRYGEAPERADVVNGVLASWERVRNSVLRNQPPGKENSR